MKDTRRHQLLVGFVSVDFVHELNNFMKSVNLKFHLDFTRNIAGLFLKVGDLPPELWLTYNHRQTPGRAQTAFLPTTERTLAIMRRINQITKNHGGVLTFVTHKFPNKKRRCLMQFHVDGARTVALTLGEAYRGTKKTYSEFVLPE